MPRNFLRHPSSSWTEGLCRTETIVTEIWAAERAAQVKEEHAQRAGDTEQNALRPKTLPRDLDVNLVGLDHAQFGACAFFDYFKPLTQVTDLGRQSLVKSRRSGIALLLPFKLAHQTGHIGHAAPAKPELAVQDQQQGDQCSRNNAIAHAEGYFRL